MPRSPPSSTTRSTPASGAACTRDAMDDGYYLGHTTADRVMKVLR